MSQQIQESKSNHQRLGYIDHRDYKSHLSIKDVVVYLLLTTISVRGMEVSRKRSQFKRRVQQTGTGVPLETRSKMMAFNEL